MARINDFTTHCCPIQALEHISKNRSLHLDYAIFHFVIDRCQSYAVVPFLAIHFYLSMYTNEY
jgi:hypothetical protein